MRQSRCAMSSAHKKVIVRRFTGETLPGYLPLSGFVRNRGIDLLDLSGRVIPLILNEIKHICYVREFNLNDTTNPERLTRRNFLARPRTEMKCARPNRTTKQSTVDAPGGLPQIPPGRKMVEVVAFHLYGKKPGNSRASL